MTRFLQGRIRRQGQENGPKVILRVRANPLPRKKRIVFLSLVLALFAFFILTQLKSRLAPKENPQVYNLANQDSALPGTKLPEFEERRVNILPGSTIADLLLPFFPSLEALYKLLEATRATYDLTKIKAGHSLLIKTLNGLFCSLTYEIDKKSYLHVRQDNDHYKASIETIPFETSVSYLAGVIQDSLIEAFNRLGEGDALALDLAEIFSWEIDFNLDLRTGDSFSLVYEKKLLQGEFVGYGPILAAQVVNQGKKYQAFRFVFPPTGKADYFDAAGKSLRKEFLRSPLKYGRITSRFSFRRLHPIRKVYRPHLGIDYAAPVGTPVQATADGVVLSAGWNGASGRMIHLRHSKGYETMYLHLSRVARGIKPGDKVQAGEVIGYVGSSGEATGPHLDYRIIYRGKYINPLAWRFEPASPLPAEFEPRFKAEIGPLEFFLSSPFFFVRSFFF